MRVRAKPEEAWVVRLRAQYRERTKARKERLCDAQARGKHTDWQWARLLVRVSGCCVRCGKEGRLQKDHITPLSCGGSDAITNLQPLCPRCNRSKGSESIDWMARKGLR